MPSTGIFRDIFRGGDHAAESLVSLGTSYGHGAFTGLLVTDQPSPDDVRLGVIYGGAIVGRLDLPGVSDVRVGVGFDQATKTGLLDLPAVADVRQGTEFDQTTKIGLLDLPAVEDVEDGVQFDQASKTGVFEAPAEIDVRLNLGYGANGTEFVGLLDVAAGGVPGVDDVRLGVTYGDANQFVGTVRVPPVEKVELGYQYDANDSLTGTLETGSMTSPFFDGEDLEIIRGDDYAGDDISWQDDGRWPDLTDATAKVGLYGEKGPEGAGGDIEFDAVVSGQKVQLPLTKEETGSLRAWYRYDVQATLSDQSVKTLVRGRLRALNTTTDIPTNEAIPPRSPA